MNRNRYLEIEDKTIDKDLYLGVWESEDKFFWVQRANGYKKHGKFTSEDCVILKGLACYKSGGYAFNIIATWAEIKSKFKKTNEGPSHWITMQVAV